MKNLIISIICVLCMTSISYASFNERCLTDEEKLSVFEQTFYIEKADYKDYDDAIGRILTNACMQEKTPAILLVIHKTDEEIYIDLVKNIIEYNNLNIELFIVKEY